MAGINPAQVYVPTPDQSTTTGAVAVAPTSTSAPTDARTALGTGWATGGYVGDAGISMSINRSMQAVKDWSQASVRKILTDFDGTISIPWLQVDEFFATRAFGTANVTKTAATSSHGEQLKVAVGPELPAIESWCFSMKDGNARVRIYIPRGQITELGEVPFVPTQANAYPSTLSCYDDGTGHSIYVMYDDGVVSA